MANLQICRTSFEQLWPLRDAYFAQTTAPLDGMWESFVEQGEHWLIEHDDVSVGYCVLNEAQQVIQFYSSQQASIAFAPCIHELGATGAVAATCDPLFHSLAVEHQKKTRINALMYEFVEGVTVKPMTFAACQSFDLISTENHMAAVDFAEATLGAPRDWLMGYYEDLIAKKELWAVWQSGQIIATGECRASPHQPGIADAGMVVGKGARGQGLATCILQALVSVAKDNGRRAICSTEESNKAAQKAIARAGFISHHQIVEFEF